MPQLFLQPNLIQIKIKKIIIFVALITSQFSNIQIFNLKTCEFSFKVFDNNTIRSKTDFGANSYRSAFPYLTKGIRQYFFKINAPKKVKLGLNAAANYTLIGYYSSMLTFQKGFIVM